MRDAAEIVHEVQIIFRARDKSQVGYRLIKRTRGHPAHVLTRVLLLTYCLTRFVLRAYE